MCKRQTQVIIYLQVAHEYKYSFTVHGHWMGPSLTEPTFECTYGTPQWMYIFEIYFKPFWSSHSASVAGLEEKTFLIKEKNRKEVISIAKLRNGYI